MNDRAKPINNGGGTVLSIQPLKGHSPCPIHVHLSKVLAYGLDSSESSPVGIGTLRETMALSTISKVWRAYRSSQVCRPVTPSQMCLWSFSIFPSYMFTYDGYASSKAQSPSSWVRRISHWVASQALQCLMYEINQGRLHLALHLYSYLIGTPFSQPDSSYWYTRIFLIGTSTWMCCL